MSRKRHHLQQEGLLDDGQLMPAVKRISPQQDEASVEESGNESTTSGAGEYRTYTPPPLLDDVTEPTDHTPIPDDILVHPGPRQENTRGNGTKRDGIATLDDVPEDALSAGSLSQFHTHMRPYLWMEYPSATTAEINAIIQQKWKLLQTSRKDSKQRRRSELTSLGGGGGEEEEWEEGGGGRRPQRRAAKNLAKNVYSMDVGGEEIEYVDSPASASSAKDTPPSEPTTSSQRRGGVGGGRKGKRGKGRRGGGLRKGKKGSGLKVPPMKIKLIGRTGASDSPIFFAESLGERWEESSGSERMKRELGIDSENSSLHLGDREEDDISVYEEGSRPASDSEGDDEEEDEEQDSEDEHADFCQKCKDGGELLCCDFCPLAYHLSCLVPLMERIPNGDWKCPRCQAKADPLSGKVERLITWRWAELPIKGAESEEDAIEDDVMTDGSDHTSKPKPQKTYKFREFLVKWRGKSYWKCSWVSEMRLEVHRQVTLRAFTRKHNMETPPPNELPPHVRHRHKRRSTTSHLDEKMEEQEMTLLQAGVRPSSLLMHRIVNKRSKKGKTQYLVKWRELPYDQSTWEDLAKENYLKGVKDAIEAYKNLRQQMDPKRLKKAERRRGRSKPKIDPADKYEDQPAYLTNGTLHGYQLEGINWLRFSWTQRTNTILADEMGLGKTIQTIAFLYSLVKEDHSNGPFLIAAPLSTIVNWEREFEIWAPELYVVTYSGDRENRAVIRENEFSFVEGAVRGGTKLFRMKKDTPTKFHVLLTSYEFISVDATILQSINWEVLVVDEAHRLKNNQSKFFRVLSTYNLNYKLLLTGTPLQNNLEELFHLLNFLNREGFNSLEEFQDEFQDISKEEQVKKLHELLAPHLLRRLKQDVLKNIPSKRELIVRVELSPMQKKYYRWILTRNFEKLNLRGSQPVSLLNVMMDLKKCCNHPYLFPTAQQEAPLTTTGYYEGTALIQACGKFIVLEKMLKELRRQGHRVLIFSQMTRMLDILEDFLEYLGYHFERIDGNVTGPERQQSIDRFNAPGATQFAFLLSTRAGGLGINLATADTVIIYDSDWNPHNDIQAFSRAHRIGQANKVMIYRFVTRGSVEERITEVAKRKMMLTHLVVRAGMGSAATQSLTKRELDDILKFGTEDLFKEESAGEQESTSIHYDDDAIAALLDRSLDMGDGESEVGQQNILANDYLSSFKVASYVMKEKGEEVDMDTTEIIKDEPQADPEFWERLLRHHYEQQRELEAAKLGKGKRVRKQVNYLDSSAADLRALDSDQSSYKQSEEEESDPETDVEDIEFSVGSKKKLLKVPLALALAVTGEALPPLLSKINGTIHVLGFTPRMRKAFLNSVMRFGIPTPGSSHSNWKSKELKNISEYVFNAYTNMFMKHVCEPVLPNSETFSDGVPRESFSRQLVLARIGTMRLVLNKVIQYASINGTHSESQPKPSSVIQEPPLKAGTQHNDRITSKQPSPDSTHKSPDESPDPTHKSANAAHKSPDKSTDPTHKSPDPTHKSADKSPDSSHKSSDSIHQSSDSAHRSQLTDLLRDSTATSEAVPAVDELSWREGESSGSRAGDGVTVMEAVSSTASGSGVIMGGGVEKGVMGEGVGESDSGAKSGDDSHSRDMKQSDSNVSSQSHSNSNVTSESNSQDSVPSDGGTEQRHTNVDNEGVEPMEVCDDNNSKQSMDNKQQHEHKNHDSVIVDPSVPVSKPAGVHEVKSVVGPPRFMFNIADGGFTELHTLWAEEKTKGFRPDMWGRHHDYWMLKGISTHGYCRWTEICGDKRFSLLNKAFVPQVETVSDPKSRFLLKRFKLLEQALAVEEQLHRASNAGLVQDPNQPVMQLHSRFTDLDCLSDGHLHLVKECMNGDINSLQLLRKALGKIEDLLVDMKMDITRLPNELSKIPSVSKQLKLDELSTLTKMALRGEVVPASVITQAPANPGGVISSSGVTGNKTKGHSSTQVPHKTSVSSSSSGKKERVAAAPETKRTKTVEEKPANTQNAQNVYSATPSGTNLVSLTGNSGLRLQTPEGLLVATSNVPYTAVQQQTSKSAVVTNDHGYTTVNVPTYVDSGQVYQAATVQLVPVTAGQQIMVWPPAVVQPGKATGTQQLTVVQGSQLLSVVDTSSTATAAQGGQKKSGGSVATATNSSIITID